MEPMKAWLLDSLAGIDALRLGDFPDPAAAPGEVVLKLDYAALNPADRYLAEGQYPARPAFPHVLGRDGVGTIVSVGPGVTDWNPGDRAAVLRSDVGVNRPGTFAELAAVPADSIVPVPHGWTDEQAASATLVYCTAYQALTMWGDLPANAIVLITGASGGVGVATLHLAKAMGFTVVALSRSQQKQKVLRDMGADFTLDPQKPKWSMHVKDVLGPRRVDLAVDNIGGDDFNRLLDTLGASARVSCVGRLAGPVPQFNTAALFFRRLRIGGVAVGTYSRDEAHAAWDAVLELLNKTGARPVIDRVFPFADLPAAFARLAEGPMGKVLVRVREPA